MSYEGPFGYLYKKFILRDLFAKIAPGSLVLLGVALAVTGDPSGKTLVEIIGRLDALAIFLLVPLLGVTWNLGFVAQRLWNLHRMWLKLPVEPPVERLSRKEAGEIRDEEKSDTELTRRHRRKRKRQRRPRVLPLPYYNLDEEDELKKHVDNVIGAMEKPQRQEYLERMSVIKEGAGNLFAATALGVGGWLIAFWNHGPQDGRLLRILAVGGFVGWLLYLEHATSLWKEAKIRDFIAEEKNESDGTNGEETVRE